MDINENYFDLIIIGAGASGLMASVGARENSNDIKIAFLEKNEKIGKKMYITGKGRCNVTNLCELSDFVQNVVHNPKFLYSCLHRFNSNDTINFFENNHCHLKVERGNRVFPKSDKSSDVIKVFANYIKEKNINVFFNTEVKSITRKNDYFYINSSNSLTFFCKYVIIATGGLSYPTTGSTGDGYVFAKTFGHNIIKTRPALTGFKVKDVEMLDGLTLKNIGLSVFVEGKKRYDEFGDITFYKNLIAGPLSLTASSYLNEYNCFKISINLKPKVEQSEFKTRFYDLLNKNQNYKIHEFLINFMPVKLAKYLTQILSISPNAIISSLDKNKIAKIFNLMLNLEFTSTGLDNVSNAIVTAGGVDVKQIEPNSFQSKLISNLFFVGEVLDVDALTGGFNMQIAFSTGYTCGEFISKNFNEVINV